MASWRKTLTNILTQLGLLKTAIQNNTFFEKINTTIVRLKSTYTELILSQIGENRQRHKWDLALSDAITRFNLTNSGLGGEVNFALTDDYFGGMLEGSTGGAIDRWVAFDTIQKVFEVNVEPESSFWIEINDVSESDVKIGFYKDADEYFLLQVIGGDIHILTNDGMTPIDENTGSFILDDNQVYFKLKVNAGIGTLYKKTSPSGTWTYLGESGGTITPDFMMIRGEILAGSATNCRLRVGRLEATQDV